VKHAKPWTLAWSGRSLGGAVLLAGLLVADAAQAAGALELIPEPLDVAILLVGFVVLIFPVNALIFQPIFRALDAREEKIAGARRRADQLEREAEELLQRYRESIREVREETESDRRQQVEAARNEHQSVAADARARAESELDQSRGELASSLDEARAQLRSSAEELGRSAAERILGRALS